ncbi:MAG TPA: HAD-IA family hydrolase [Trebonia sp.]|jgi:putative hydrolase of the HAD superfamily
MTRAIVFDFDGLLMDTESTSLLSWQYEWGQWGLTLEMAGFFVNHGGDVTEDRYATLAATVGPRFDRTVSHRRRVAYRDKLLERLDLADGLRGWLDEAAGLGLRLAVASSSPRQWLTTHLGRAGVLDTFEVLAAGDEVARHKPAPDVYQLALGRLSLSGAAAVAVEDTAHGVSAAHAAGMRCIAIPNPFVTPDRVSHADLVLSSASQLPLADALRQLSRS